MIEKRKCRWVMRVWEKFIKDSERAKSWEEFLKTYIGSDIELMEGYIETYECYEQFSKWEHALIGE